MNIPNPPLELLSQIKTLRQYVLEKSETQLEQWRGALNTADLLEAGRNLAEYLALREQDLRDLQDRLSDWGLSSLGRAEGRVQQNLEAVQGALEALCGLERSVFASDIARTTAIPSSTGKTRLHLASEQIFGPARANREVRILLTLNTDPIPDSETLERLLEAGMDAVRLNCAHGNPKQWLEQLQRVLDAAQAVNHPCPVLMDLAGPKLRLESVSDDRHLKVGEIFQLALERPNKAHDKAHNKAHDKAHGKLWATLAIPEVFAALTLGQTVAYDDGHLYATVETVGHNFAELRVTHAREQGIRLKPDKGVNFPSLELRLDPLTPKDLEDLDFVAQHADLIGYSFVQDAADLERLQQELERRGVDLGRKTIVAKIETARAVRNLPELIVQGRSKGSFAVMIARGDLALELGFERLAEMQEELLWMCEAASVPVIWATGVLEGLVKEGLPSRGEMTDAAMSARAECVMLNKGRHQLEGLAALSNVLARMGGHLRKKESRLRALSSWSAS
jgi:pyruvate kinase